MFAVGAVAELEPFVEFVGVSFDGVVDLFDGGELFERRFRRSNFHITHPKKGMLIHTRVSALVVSKFISPDRGDLGHCFAVAVAAVLVEPRR